MNRETPEETGVYFLSSSLPQHCLYTRVGALQKLKVRKKNWFDTLPKLGNIPSALQIKSKYEDWQSVLIFIQLFCSIRLSIIPTPGGADIHHMPSGHLCQHGWQSSPLDQNCQHWQTAHSPTGPAPTCATKQLPADLLNASQPLSKPLPQPLSQPRAGASPPLNSWTAPSPGLQPPLTPAPLSGRVWASSGCHGWLRGVLLWKP